MDDNWPYKGKTDFTLFHGDHGYQFRGYHLDALQRRPTFQYQYGDIKVEDFLRGCSR